MFGVICFDYRCSYPQGALPLTRRFAALSPAGGRRCSQTPMRPPSCTTHQPRLNPCEGLQTYGRPTAMPCCIYSGDRQPSQGDGGGGTFGSASVGEANLLAVRRSRLLWDATPAPCRDSRSQTCVRGRAPWRWEQRYSKRITPT